MEKETEKKNGSFEETLKRSRQIEQSLIKDPSLFRVLTGDRPTGNLHIGHLFGTLMNRVRLQNMGVETFIVIADYQVLTDRDTADMISQNIQELVIDYLSCGITPESGHTHIFPHSHVPELNQLILPFLFLVTNEELRRNPTVKEEIQAAGIKNINAGMYIYPVHQTADILAVKGNLVPVGKDQLPHLELARVISRRFNQKFGKGNAVLREPEAFLSEAPVILGIDGSQKMSKSRNNAIMLKSTEDETAAMIKKAKTDCERKITYEPERRPEISSLIRLAALSAGRDPQEIAEEAGDGGSGKLKNIVVDSLNEYLAPIRKRRKEIEKDRSYIKDVLNRGVAKARGEAEETLSQVRRAMNMEF